MRRNALAALVPVGIAAVLAISLASCGQASTSSSSAGASSSTNAGPPARELTVTPSTGGPTTTFSLRFIAPASSAVGSASKIGYTLGLAAPSGSACVASRSIQIPAATKGDPVSVALDPTRLGGTWCQGTYKARVLELQTPVCPPGAMCPQFVRVIETVGTARFMVVGSG